MDKPLGLQLQKLHTGQVTSCDFNLNYLLAIGSSDRNVRILEWKTGLGFVDLYYSPLSYHKYGVTSVRFSPKGTMLASSSLDGTAVLIDVFSGARLFTMVQYNTSNIKFCEFTFDCMNLITGADDGMICFWDLVHQSQLGHFCLHEGDFCLKGLAITPDSEYLLSVDSGNLLKLWLIQDIVNNQLDCLLAKKNIHDDVFCCDFSPVKSITGGAYLKVGYRVVTSGGDGLLKIWDVMIEKYCSGKPECDLILFRVLKHDQNILGIRFSAEGKYLVGTGLDNLVRLWEVDTGKCLEVLRGHARFVTCAAFSKDTTLLATGSIDKTFVIWDLSGKLTLDSILLPPCKVSCHFTHIDTFNYSTSKRHQKREEERKKCNEYIVIQKINVPSAVNSVAFQREDVLAIAGGNKTITIWRKQGGNYEGKELLEEHEYNINHLDVSSCGEKIISSSVDGLMIFWDLNMGLTYKMKTPNCTSSLRTCKFSSDSKLIAAGGDDQNVYLWDSNNLEFIKVLQRHENAITAVAFTPDDEFLVSCCCGSEIMLHSLKRNKLTSKTANAHDLGVLCCDFSALETECADEFNTNRVDQNIYLLATGGNDSLVKLWKVSSSEIQEYNILSGHGGTVNCVKFSPNKPVLASCSSDNTVRIWDTKTKKCLQVLNSHQSPVTTCSFSKDSSLLATGSLDKTVLILNSTERFCHEPSELYVNSNKLLEKWTTSDVVNWFLDIGCPDIADKFYAMQLNGAGLLNLNEDTIRGLGLSEKMAKELKLKVLILKKLLSFPHEVPNRGKKVPHEFLCPITHQIMTEPVICSDGYTYDRAALTEWFLGGKSISPVTKECLRTRKLLPYSALKINIFTFLKETGFCE